MDYLSQLWSRFFFFKTSHTFFFNILISWTGISPYPGFTTGGNSQRKQDSVACTCPIPAKWHISKYNPCSTRASHSWSNKETEFCLSAMKEEEASNPRVANLYRIAPACSKPQRSPHSRKWMACAVKNKLHRRPLRVRRRRQKPFPLHAYKHQNLNMIAARVQEEVLKRWSHGPHNRVQRPSDSKCGHKGKIFTRGSLEGSGTVKTLGELQGLPSKPRCFSGQDCVWSPRIQTLNRAFE